MNNSKMNISNFYTKILLSLFFSVFIFFGCGYYIATLSVQDLLLFKIVTLLTTFFLSTYISFYFKSLKYIHFTILIIIALYSFIGISYGPPNSSLLASLLETNKQETIEFFININYWVLLFSIAFISCCILFIIIPLSLPTNVFWKKKLVKLCIAIFYCLLIYTGFQYPTYGFFRKIEYMVEDYYIYKNIFNQTKEDYPFAISYKESYKKNKFYIVIIGESVRRDYMSLYGYPINTTPFLNQVNGTFFNNYISAAPNTNPALHFTLSLSNTNRRHPLSENIVNLARTAGYNTYWISNQGGAGPKDVLTSEIAKYSENIRFLKYGDYNLSNISDFRLLSILNEIVQKETSNSVIFLHMIGSHPDTCLRVSDFPRTFNISKNEKINCYLDSILKLDSFIKKAKLIMDSTKEKYSLIYFSDHGMDISEAAIKVNFIYQENYMIPFFILNSDDQKKIYINEKISAVNFPAIFANWIGVTSEQIKNINDFKEISESKIKVFNWHKFVDFDTLETQKALKAE